MMLTYCTHGLERKMLIKQSWRQVLGHVDVQ